MLLCIDVGNTNTVVGVYEGDDLVAHWRFSTDHGRMPDEYGMLLLNMLHHAGIATERIAGVAISSVVPPVTEMLAEMVSEYLKATPLIVGTGVKTGVAVRYDPPREVGADRIVNAAAAYRLYGGPACVVDFGTGTTFDALSRKGDTWAAPSRRGFAWPPRRSFSARRNCRVSIWSLPKRRSAPIRWTPCAPVSSLAMWVW